MTTNILDICDQLAAVVQNVRIGSNALVLDHLGKIQHQLANLALAQHQPTTDAERLDFLLDLEDPRAGPQYTLWNFATDTLPAEGYDAREHKLRQINLTLALLKTYEEFCK